MSELEQKAKEQAGIGTPIIKIMKVTGLSRKRLAKLGITTEYVTEQRDAAITRYKILGLKQAEIAAKIGVSLRTVKTVVSKIEKGRGKDEVTIISKHVSGKVYTDAHKGAAVAKQDYDEWFAGEYDLWAYPNDRLSMGKFLITTEKGLYGSATLNIPYPELQPAKRIHIVSNSLYEWRTEDRGVTWKAFNNYVMLVNPDKPLMDVARHDVDTVNLMVGFPKTSQDTIMTMDDACIVSMEAAQRLRFLFNYSHTFIMAEEPKMEFEVEAGVRVIPETGKDFIDKAAMPPATGRFIVESVNKLTGNTLEGLISVKGKIVGERDAAIGDKLTGLSGLKTVIGEIRANMDCDIIIHPKEVWGEKESSKRGSMVKELQDTGKIMVGMRKDTVSEMQASLLKGMRISVTVYPVMKLYAEGTLKQIVDKNSRFGEVLNLLHLKYDGQRFRLLPESEIDTEDELWIKYPHVLYESEVRRQEGEFPVYDEDVTRYYKGGNRNSASEKAWMLKNKYDRVKETEQVSKIAWDYCYNPTFFNPFYLNSRGKVQYANVLLEDEKGNYGKTWLDIENEDFTSDVRFPWGISPRASGRTSEDMQYGYAPVKNVVLDNLFCTIRDGKYLVIVPQIDLPMDIVEVGIKDFGKVVKGKRYGLIIREPVVSKEGIRCVEIRYNADIPTNVMKVSPEIVRNAFGDYDGDRMALIPYYAKGLRPSKDEINTKRKAETAPKMDIKELEPIKRSRDELIKEAIRAQNDFVKNLRQVGEFGGLKNKGGSRKR
jgi:DNA-binding XRE family transcriptional regulator